MNRRQPISVPQKQTAVKQRGLGAGKFRIALIQSLRDRVAAHFCPRSLTNLNSSLLLKVHFFPSPLPAFTVLCYANLVKLITITKVILIATRQCAFPSPLLCISSFRHNQANSITHLMNYNIKYSQWVHLYGV